MQNRRSHFQVYTERGNVGLEPPLQRRKPEAANRAGGDSALHHLKGCKKWEEKLKPYRTVRPLKIEIGFKREMGTGICRLPTFSQIRVSGDWIFETDCWFSKFGQWPMGEVSGPNDCDVEKAIQTTDQDEWGFGPSKAE